MPPDLTPPHIPLFLNIREHWGRSIARGIVRTLRDVVEWIPFVGEQMILPERGILRNPNCLWAGVIGQFYAPHHAFLHELTEAGIPVVNVSAVPPPSGVGWIHCDDVACGRMAAHHFLERNFRHFAYFGMPGSNFSQQREKGFLEELNRTPWGPVRTVGDSGSPPADSFQYLVNDLQNLPKPCAIFCANDVRARHCLQATEAAGITVPEECAILGVDDDDLHCNMARVPISSVQPDWERIGRRAVETLLDLKNEPNKNPVKEAVPPHAINVRRSSHFFATEDALVAKAMQQIQATLDGKLSTESLAAKLGVSRRTLERHFTRETNRSIHDTLLEARLQRAYNLVLESNLPIGEIATSTGFSKHSQFNAFFKKRFATTPRSLRRST